MNPEPVEATVIPIHGPVTTGQARQKILDQLLIHGYGVADDGYSADCPASTHEIDGRRLSGRLLFHDNDGGIALECEEGCFDEDILDRIGLEPTAIRDPAPDVEKSSWARVDLSSILAGTHVQAEPTMFERTDGVALLYPGLVHSFHGESESGKSLIIQLEAIQRINSGEDVLFIDFESDAASVVHRLLDFGATPEAIAKHFDYRLPDVKPDKGTAYDDWCELISGTYSLAILDGVTESLGLFGYSTRDNDDITTWNRSVPKMISTRTGAAVVVIDHVTKDADTRGRFAIGGQAKLAALTGAGYVVEVAEPLGRGLKGVVVLSIAKDRPGSVRPHCGEFHKTTRLQEAARVIIDSTGTTPTWEIVPPDMVSSTSGAMVGGTQTATMEAISLVLESAQEPVNTNMLKTLVTGKHTIIREAANRLLDEGFIAVENGKNRAKIYTSVKAYRKPEPTGEPSRWGL